AVVVVDDVAAVRVEEAYALLGTRPLHERVALQPVGRGGRIDLAVQVAAGSFVARVAQLLREIEDAEVLLDARRIEAGEREEHAARERDALVAREGHADAVVRAALRDQRLR